MLKQIHIRDFAILTELELDFAAGLTVFTGETGAGKSILIEALGLVLGVRADASMVRQGADRADITAIFAVDQIPQIQSLLEEQGLDSSDNEAIVRRQVRADGGSRAWLNGSPVPVQVLREIGDYLVDIHGQHEHQSLLRRDAQRGIVDDYGKLSSELQRVAFACQAWRDINKALSVIGEPGQDRSAEVELLRYQIGELEATVLSAEALQSLEDDHKRLSNLRQITDTSQQVLLELFDADDAAATHVSQALRRLQDLQGLDAKLSPVVELLESAEIQLAEAEAELRRYQDDLDLSPDTLQAIEEKLQVLYDLARKHRLEIRQLPEHLLNLQARLDAIENSEVHFQQLQQQLSETLADYQLAAAQLHDARKTVAADLSGKVSAAMQELGMSGGRFEIQLEQHTDASPTPQGNDQLEFLVSANPGQGLRPLKKVASGGELSRISLAIQVIASSDKGVPTLVFDEVDTGIGGGVAEVVGQKLRELAHSRQVMCVTHLPQVAAQGQNHLQVKKDHDGKQTHTGIELLAGEVRVEEIARMLGGIKLTEQTLAHAREMLGLQA